MFQKNRLFKNLRYKNFILCGSIFSLENPEINKEDYEKFKVRQGLFVENKWERVKFIFRREKETGTLHPDMQKTIQMAQTGFMVGGALGGMLHSLKSAADFQRQSAGDAFTSRYAAQKKLAQKNLEGFVSGALKVAPLTAFLFSSYTLLSACIVAYRNKHGVIEYIIGGAGVGMLFRIHYGLKGMISGGIIGCVLGTIYGIIYVSVLNALGMNVLELKYGLYALSNYKNGKDVNDLALDMKKSETSNDKQVKLTSTALSAFDISLGENLFPRLQPNNRDSMNITLTVFFGLSVFFSWSTQ